MKDRSPLSDLFEVQYGSQFDLNKMSQTTASDPERINFVSRKRDNLGISAFVRPYRNTAPFPPGLITVALGGSYLLTAFVQERQFYTAQNVAVLTPRVSLGFAEKVFYCLCLRKNRFRYSAFGREANRTLALIEMPASVPERFRDDTVSIVAPNAKPAIAHNLPNNDATLNPNKWKKFKLGNLFDIQKGKRLTKREMIAGDVPYIGASRFNNGITEYIGQDPIFPGGIITVSYDGSVGEAFYQPDPFWASDAVNVLKPRFDMSTYVAMFIITIIRQEQYKFSYGRKWKVTLMRQHEIKLPVNELGEADLGFMEEYIKMMPYTCNL